MSYGNRIKGDHISIHSSHLVTPPASPTVNASGIRKKRQIERLSKRSVLESRDWATRGVIRQSIFVGKTRPWRNSISERNARSRLLDIKGSLCAYVRVCSTLRCYYTMLLGTTSSIEDEARALLKTTQREGSSIAHLFFIRFILFHLEKEEVVALSSTSARILNSALSKCRHEHCCPRHLLTKATRFQVDIHILSVREGITLLNLETWTYSRRSLFIWMGRMTYSEQFVLQRAYVAILWAKTSAM